VEKEGTGERKLTVAYREYEEPREHVRKSFVFVPTLSK
jgi:hypothetical protein